MASTIITKHNFTSSVKPSSLTQGELAINIADGALFYGTSGSSNAVSSSFTFNHVTASGNISASGELFANNITVPLQAGTDNSVVVLSSADRLVTDEIRSEVWGSNALVHTGIDEWPFGETVVAPTATKASVINATANNSTDETTYLTFVDGATGDQGIETDTGLTYNPASGYITASGGINAGNIVVAGDIIHSGDDNNKIALGTDTQDFQTGGSSRLDLSDSGVRLGGTGARVTSITDSDSLGTSDTVLCTQGNVKAYVDARYHYNYIHFLGNSNIDTNWSIPATNGPNAHNWNTDTGESGTSVGSTTISVARAKITGGFTIPFTGVLVGFAGMIRNNENSNQGALGLFHAPWTDFGGKTTATNFTLQAYALGVTTGGAGGSYMGNCKAIDTSRSLAVAAGDIIIPAALQDADKIYFNFSVIIKTPII